MGHDFVFGYIQAIDGEKDPRNLLNIFSMTTLVVKHLDISRFVEVKYPHVLELSTTSARHAIED